MISCAVALVLLLDASASITPPDWRLQLEGHADAIEAIGPTVQRGEPVAVAAFAFSELVQPLVRWRLIRTEADAREVAAELRQAPRGQMGGTEIPHALRVARNAMADAPCQAEQEVIDLVTDGEAHGPATARERDLAAAEGVRINALGVGSPEAADWLRQHAVTPGGFVMQVERWEDFARAIRRKIALEVASVR